jgi:hypothetical protein
MASRGPLIVATVLPLALLSTLFGGARLYVRLALQRHRLHLDDAVIAASLVSSWAATATALSAVHAGHGRHLSSLTPADTERIMRLTTVSFAFGIFSFALPKFAVVSLVVRLLQPGRWQRVFLWGLVGFCFVVLSGNIPGLVAQCRGEQVVGGGKRAGEGAADFTYVSRSCIGPQRSLYYSISSSGESCLLFHFPGGDEDAADAVNEQQYPPRRTCTSPHTSPSPSRD